MPRCQKCVRRSMSERANSASLHRQLAISCGPSGVAPTSTLMFSAKRSGRSGSGSIGSASIYGRGEQRPRLIRCPARGPGDPDSRTESAARPRAAARGRGRHNEAARNPIPRAGSHARWAGHRVQQRPRRARITLGPLDIDGRRARSEPHRERGGEPADGVRGVGVQLRVGAPMALQGDQRARRRDPAHARDANSRPRSSLQPRGIRARPILASWPAAARCRRPG